MPNDFFKALEQSSADMQKRRVQNNSLIVSLATADTSIVTPTSGSQMPGGGGRNNVPLPAGDANARIVAEAKKYIGIPYVSEGYNPKDGFNCSSYTSWVLKKALGISVPALSGTQAQRGQLIKNLKQASPGDLLFFDLGSRDTWKGIDHVAIYMGNGKMIEAPRPGKNIGIVNVYATPKFIRRYG